ncbi:hypothetical protein IR073_01400 [Gemella sp. 19428wG2_WT2a]|nr:hypothetical protein [Gemella sp. 19428wG2_WT2a]TFU60609.1 hypothetical protein E4T67_01390 [Gemella sp. WT2a]
MGILQKAIEEVLNERTAYSLAKSLNLPPNQLQYYKNGERKIENMSLKLADKLYEIYLEKK